MTAQRPDPGERPGEPPARQDNGLRAAAYVPLTDVDTQTGQQLLSALGRARIAAYLMLAVDDPSARGPARLYVASEERVDARTIVLATVRALGSADPQLPDPADDPLAGVDTDAVFRELVADWHVDTHDAIRAAERDLRREDAEWRSRLVRPPVEDPVWLDDDHYVPPPPPPLPRLAPPTVAAIVVAIVSILVLGFGGEIGFDDRFSVLLGVAGLLLAATILFTRVRDRRRDDEDDEDDGAEI